MQESQKRSGFPEICSAPWLTFLHGKPNKMSQTFYSLSEKRFYVRCIQEMRNSRCWATVNGWILILDLPSLQWSLLNPKTMVKIELPQLDQDPDNCFQCLLSSAPTDPDCVIMCTNFRYNLLYFCRPGDNKWIKHTYDLGVDKLCFAVACNDKFYALTGCDSFAIIDFPPHPGIRILGTKLDLREPIRLEFHCTHLVESCGKIFMVLSYYLAFNEKLIYIVAFQMNFSTTSWDRVDSIGNDRIFILGYRRFAVSWSASELGVKGDCIYLMKDGGMIMYVFDMKEGTLAARLPCPNIREEWSRPLWIVPPP